MKRRHVVSESKRENYLYQGLYEQTESLRQICAQHGESFRSPIVILDYPYYIQNSVITSVAPSLERKNRISSHHSSPASSSFLLHPTTNYFSVQTLCECYNNNFMSPGGILNLVY